MKRMAAVLAGAMLVTMLGLTGVANAASVHLQAPVITVDSQWTIVVAGFGCEAETITGAHTWAADRGFDSGTWTKDKLVLWMNWTAGNGVGLRFKGKWDGTEFAGTLSVPGARLPAILVPGYFCE